MAEDKISSIVDVAAIEKEIDKAKLSVDDLVKHIQAVKATNINISGAKSVSEYNALRKELDLLIKQTDISAKAAINEAKARSENSKAVVNEAKARDIDAKAAERQAKASEKAAQKATEEERPYKKLAMAFAAQAKHAQDLAARYGTMDKRSQAAAKRANELNNELKKIDATIGNHQRNVGNYGSALDSAGGKLKSFATNFLALIGVAGVGSVFSSAIDEFLEMDKNVRMLQNTLRNIGVPEAFDRIKNSADELATQFTYLDNDDILKTFNQLIVYGKLTEDQINQLVPVIIDFAAATGQDMASATSTIIKSLEGNGKALKEFGINMKDAKGTTEAFSLIMSELKPRVDGVGKSFGDSAAGGIASAKQEFKDLKEELGSGLLPVLNNILSVLNDLIKGAFGFGKALKDATSGDKSFVASILEGADNKDIEFEANAVFQQQMLILKNSKEFLKERQAQGKLLEFTEDDITKEHIDNLSKRLEAEKKYYDGIKKGSNREIIMSSLSLIRGYTKALDELNTKQSGGKILGVGGSTSNTAADDKANQERLRQLEASRRAEFEILKLELELRADLNKKIADDETQFYSRRLLALNDFALAKSELINATADFELQNTKLTAKEIELVEAKRIDALVRLNDGLGKSLKKTSKDLNEGATGAGVQVDGMTKSIAAALKKSKDDWDKYAEGIKNNRQAIKDALKELAGELQGLIFDLFTADIERQKNAVQDQIDLLEQQKQKDIEVANQTITNAQDKAAAIATIEARAAAQREQLERRQRQLNVEAAKFERARAVAGIIQNTAQGITAALASVPPNPILAAIVGAIGAAQLARTLITPIPRYRHGTDNHPGGPAMVGDGGKHEGLILPDGSVLKSPAKNTVMDLPAGTVVHPDYDKMMLNATLTKVPEFRVKTVSNDEALKKVGRDIVRAIKNQPQPVINSEKAYIKAWKIGNTWQDYIKGNL